MSLIKVFSDKEALSEAFAHHLLARAEKSESVFRVALSGGSTPKRAFEIMAGSDLERSKLEIYMVDERYVPPTDERSNERMMREAFGAKFTFFPMYREGGVDVAAAAYDELVRSRGTQFDLVLLGMGDDGHTASIFPRLQPVVSDGVWCVASEAPVVCSERVTLTPAPLCEAGETIFMAAGESKAEMVKRVLEGPEDFEALPSQMVTRQAANCQWWLDEGAASLLSSKS